MINDLIGKNGVKVSSRTPSQWQVGLDDATLALIARLQAQLTSVQAQVSALAAALPATPTTSPSAPTFTTGTALLNFGAFPGATEASATVLTVAVQPSSLVLVWPSLTSTASHTATDPYLEEFQCEVTSTGSGSFTFLARPRVGLSFDTYRFNYLVL